MPRKSPELPPPEVLAERIRLADNLAALARELRVPAHIIYDRVRMLNVRPGDPARPEDRFPPGESRARLRRRAAENLELFQLAISDVERLEMECRQYQEELRALQERIDPPSRPLTLDAIVAEAQATGAVAIVPKAVRNARKVPVDLERLCMGLFLLKDVYVPYRRGAMSKLDAALAIKAAGYEEKASLHNRGKLYGMGYSAVWEGQPILLDRHLAWGNTSGNLIRIYFTYDAKAQMAVVGWMPDHLPVHHYA